MDNRWYQEAVIYCVELDVFRDGDGDGKGNFPGLTQGLAYLAGLGVNCLWLLPFIPRLTRTTATTSAIAWASTRATATSGASPCSWTRRRTAASGS